MPFTPGVSGCDLVFGGVRLAGAQVGEGEACRYAIRYGRAERWGPSGGVADLNNSDQDTTALPPACPQDASPVSANAPAQSEDCLFGTVYTPAGVRQGADLPVFVWIHGGSYLVGSASAPGLDASALARRGDMIVVVIQYRLGVLGLLPPAGLGEGVADPNLALGDVTLALRQVQRYVGLLGGDGARITVGGQSSGGSMVRALLASPQAQGLFRAAVIQSDPMTYGTASRDTTRQLQTLFYASPELSGCGDMACYRRVPLQDILAAQTPFIVQASEVVEGVPLVTLNPSQVSSFPSGPGRVPLLITTTAHEGGSVAQALFPTPIPADNATYAALLGMFVGPERAASIVGGSEFYALNQGGGGANIEGGANSVDSADALRSTVERLVTDSVWRCASRDFARRWAGAGGAVWVGEWTRGVRYVSNAGGSYCTGGRVCHEDDIFATFSSAPNPDAAAQQLQDEVIQRWSGFIHNLDPNTPAPAPAPPSPTGGSNIALPPSLAIPPRPSVRPDWREPGRDGSRFLPSGPLVPAPGDARVGPGMPRPAPAPAPGSGMGMGISVGLGSGPGAGAGAGPARGGVQLQADVHGIVGRQTRTPGARWARYTAGEGVGVGNVYAIGGGEVLGCPAGVWGEAIKFDWQL